MFSYKKVGGLTFVRVWRLSASFCVIRKRAAAQAEPTPRLRSKAIDGRRVLILTTH